MKPKKHRQIMRKFWKLEYNTFLQSMGELNLEKKASVKLRTRLKLCLTILRAPCLAKRKKLIPTIENKWGKSGLKDPLWTNYEKVNGLLRFKCRTGTKNPGEVVEIMVNETYWSEAKAIKLLSKDLLKSYNEAKIRG